VISIRLRHSLVLAALVVLTVIGACSDDTPASSTATVTATPDLPVIEVPVTEVPATTWLIEAETGTRHVLVEDAETFPYAAAFEVSDGVEVAVVRYADHERRFTLDGAEAPSTASSAVCESGRGRVTLGGREYEAPSCGPVSPDGRWMFYTVTTGEGASPGGPRVPVYEAWVLDLEGGDTRLLEGGLLHCGGCDGRWGPRWSPDGSRVAFAEIGGAGRVFLADLELGTTEQLDAPQGANDFTSRPVWSSDGTLLLRPGAEGRTLVEDLPADASTTVEGVAWPARFDLGGTAIYSPAWHAPPKEPTTEGPRTTVYDPLTRATLGVLDGVPGVGNAFADGPPSVAVRADEVLAALQEVPGCSGTTVYRGADSTTCVERGAVGYLSPGLRHAVVLQLVGSTGEVTTPGVSATSLGRYDVTLVDLATGAERVVATGAVSSAEPPAVAWSEDGTHLLVRWPVWSGL
jgi:hypothetical protein